MPNDSSTLELPQVFSRTVGPIQPVSVFQGYDPRTMAQVEGPYRGGWTPLMQDPMTYAAMGPTMGLAQMFANAAMQGAPAIIPDRRGWLKIPNTTEPDLGSGRTAFASSRENPEWAGRVDVTDPRTVPMRGGTRGDLGAQPYRISRETNPFPYTPDPKGGGWTRVGSEGKPDVPDPRPNYADIRQQMQQRISDAEKLAKQRQFEGYFKAERGPDGGWVKIPVSTYQGKMSAPLPPRWGGEFENWMRQHASPEGLTAGGALVPIPEQQPLRVTTPGGTVMQPSVSIGPASTMPVRPTEPIGTVFNWPKLSPEGRMPPPYGESAVLGPYAPETTILPSLTDLFRELPE